MDATTLLRRMPLGDAELAVPSRGLSITQRRILTLLDTPARIGTIVLRLSLDRERIERDVARLAQSGLVREERGSEDAAQGGDAVTTVRLGAPALMRKLPVVMVAGVAAALVWVGWQYALPRTPSAPSRTHGGATQAGLDAQAQSAAAEPAAIATRVLRGDIADRTRDSARAAATGARPPTPAASPERATSNAAAIAPSVSDRSATIEAPADHGVVAMPSTAMPAHAQHDSPNPGDTTSPPGAATTPDATPPDGSAAASSAVAAPVSTAAPPATTTQASPPTSQSSVAAPPTSQPAVTAPPISAPPAPLPAAASAALPAGSGREPAAIPVVAHTQLASLTPSATSVRAAPVALVPIAREAPDFPREAIAQGIETGMVKARLAIDAQGKVSSVEIVDAMPRRVFDRVVRDALSRWQFPPGTAGRSTTVDVAFKRD